MIEAGRVWGSGVVGVLRCCLIAFSILSRQNRQSFHLKFSL